MPIPLIYTRMLGCTCRSMHGGVPFPNYEQPCFCIVGCFMHGVHPPWLMVTNQELLAGAAGVHFEELKTLRDLISRLYCTNILIPFKVQIWGMVFKTTTEKVSTQIVSCFLWSSRGLYWIVSTLPAQERIIIHKNALFGELSLPRHQVNHGGVLKKYVSTEKKIYPILNGLTTEIFYLHGKHMWVYFTSMFNLYSYEGILYWKVFCTGS